jgi:hypothetical protein
VLSKNYISGTNEPVVIDFVSVMAAINCLTLLMHGATMKLTNEVIFHVIILV